MDWRGSKSHFPSLLKTWVGRNGFLFFCAIHLQQTLRQPFWMVVWQSGAHWAQWRDRCRDIDFSPLPNKLSVVSVEAAFGKTHGWKESSLRWNVNCVKPYEGDWRSTLLLTETQPETCKWSDNGSGKGFQGTRSNIEQHQIKSEFNLLL